jgi:hypothetical protein
MAKAGAPTEESQWYSTERNTESLVKTVIAVRKPGILSGDDLWSLLQLTWINAGWGRTSPDHWKALKVPALGRLFGQSPTIFSDLDSTISDMGLPRPVARAAAKQTGFVNAYRVYRNSLRGWCSANLKELRTIVATAENLGSNDQARFDLAQKIDSLPGIPSPSGDRQMAAANVITSLAACLDPRHRFPIINGEQGVTRRLSKLGLASRKLTDQVAGFIGLIGSLDCPTRLP